MICADTVLEEGDREVNMVPAPPRCPVSRCPDRPGRRWPTGRSPRDAAEFVTTLVSLAARAVNSGRRVGKQESAVDVLSNVAQHRHGFNIESLPISTQRSQESIY